MKSSKTWVVVTDSIRMRIFVADTPLGPLVEAGNLVHGEGRLRNQDLVSDDGGRAFDSKGSGRHGTESKTDAKTQEQVNFTTEICHYLEEEYQASSYKRLFLVAPPAMMGLLRDHLGKHIQQALVGTLDKNLVQISPAKIRSHLPDKLWMLNG
jgi:protein required for attachment to host cells